ncbi:kinase-like domain-containing protein [Rhizophagus clarus]|uniref:Kinase-like domain-containing protein n=1 Tax=Rhizophagus clarus TaxID=94130 RepID=A0A8H3L579_9GLOM|nr:kinase-like domain-containing protein [Rhizophagus clarus]
MDEIKLSDDVIEQIRDFKYWSLTEKQKSLIDKLILNEEFKEYGHWTSGNNEVDKLIQEVQLKAKNKHQFLDSQGITAEFLKKSESNIIASESGNGCLRQYLNDNLHSLSWNEKIEMLCGISIGLKDIHNSGLIHRDFHCGNLLSGRSYEYNVFITDLGLYQPVNVKYSQSDNKRIYGVLPYMAPEVLRGKEYTQTSDIYGFGIVAYEICTGLPPYHDIAHDEFLAIRICNGLRPQSNYKITQLILDIINQCWDADLSKRPKANDLYELVNKLFIDSYNKDCDIHKQIEEANEINDKSSSTVQPPSLSTSNLSYTTHPQAVYTKSLRMDFKGERN